MRFAHHLTVFAAVPVLAALSAQTSACFAADILIESAWARATTARAQTAAVYLSITNKGAADKVVGVTTPAAGAASVHETVKKGDVVGMRAVEGGLPVPAGGSATLAPGGYHIMLTKLAKPLTKGSSFPLTVRFEKAGQVETTVHVEAAGAGGPKQDAGPGHDMDQMKGMKGM